MPTLRFNSNGHLNCLEVAVQRMLVDVVRDDLGLKGTKVACDQAVCGASTMLLNGALAASCHVIAFEADQCSVTTIEGLAAAGGTLHPVEEAFAERGAFQCGYCLPGLLLNMVSLLFAHPSLTREQVLDALDGCVCRCTGYQQVIDAVFAAAERVADQRAASCAPYGTSPGDH